MSAQTYSRSEPIGMTRSDPSPAGRRCRQADEGRALHDWCSFDNGSALPSSAPSGHLLPMGEGKKYCAFSHQRGTVLLVSTIILLVLSLLAVVMAKSAIFETRMAGAARNAQLAQLAADSAMNEARAKIARIARRDGAKAVCAALRCMQRAADAPGDPVAFMRIPAVRAAANPFRMDMTRQAGGDATAQLAASPVYVVEDLGLAPLPPGSHDAPRRLFRLTASGTGGSADFTRAVESVYAVAEDAAPAG